MRPSYYREDYLRELAKDTDALPARPMRQCKKKPQVY
jgi:hypothetical protein